MRGASRCFKTRRTSLEARPPARLAPPLPTLLISTSSTRRSSTPPNTHTHTPPTPPNPSNPSKHTHLQAVLLELPHVLVKHLEQQALEGGRVRHLGPRRSGANEEHLGQQQRGSLRVRVRVCEAAFRSRHLVMTENSGKRRLIQGWPDTRRPAVNTRLQILLALQARVCVLERERAAAVAAAAAVWKCGQLLQPRVTCCKQASERLAVTSVNQSRSGQALQAALQHGGC